MSKHLQSPLFSLLTGNKGTFSDFWNGQKDPHFPRHGGPFLSKQWWGEVLPQAGFNGIDFLLDDYAGQSSCTVIVATAVESPESVEHLCVRVRPEYSFVSLTSSNIEQCLVTPKVNW